MRTVMVLAALGVALAVTAAAPQRVPVSRFDETGIEGWSPRHFTGRTRFRLVPGEDGTVLEAVAAGSASALYRRVEVDLEETPWLHWSWKVTDPLPPHEERTRSGDDFAARLYVGFPGGIAFWRTRSIAYLWSSAEPLGASWRSPFLGRVRYIAVETGADADGWVHEARHVGRDYRQLFDTEPRAPGAIGLMTDSDGVEGAPRTAARYANIYFSSSPEPTAGPSPERAGAPAAEE